MLLEQRFVFFFSLSLSPLSLLWQGICVYVNLVFCETHVEKAGLRLRDLLVSASGVVGIKVCATSGCPAHWYLAYWH